jgi:colicin import membrane protein
MATSRKVAENMAAKAVQTFHLKAKAAAETATAEKATAEKAAAEKAAAEKAAAEKAAADKTAAAEKAAADKTAAAEKAAADKTAAWRQKAIVKARAERKKMRTAYKTAARNSQALRESKLSLSHLEALALAYPDGRSNAAHREDDASSTTSWHSTEN